MLLYLISSIATDFILKQYFFTISLRFTGTTREVMGHEMIRIRTSQVYLLTHALESWWGEHLLVTSVVFSDLFWGSTCIRCILLKLKHLVLSLKIYFKCRYKNFWQHLRSPLQTLQSILKTVQEIHLEIIQKEVVNIIKSMYFVSKINWNGGGRKLLLRGSR